MNRFYIDVAPLQEKNYTGIPQVTAKLCECLLGDSDLEPGFFYNRHEVPTPIVEEMLRARSGELYRWAAERYCFKPLVRSPASGHTVALHTNMKFARRLFPTEGQIVHDLTTVVTPQYHTAETNAYHIEKFYGDLMSNDVTFCVSQSTAQDVTTLYAGLPGPVVVSHLGVDWNHIDEDVRALPVEAEQYVFVLGTIEPRKNIGDLLSLLARNRQLARRYRFVFGGRAGWGNAFEDEVIARGLGDLLQERRLFCTGFISEAAKYLLIRNAAAVIYPSIYEGFGLPVAEAISLGVPVVTTPSSSLPEVGRNLADYFMPGDVDGLGVALKAALARGSLERDATASALAEWRRYFSWARCFSVIKDGLLAAASEKKEASDVRH